MARTPTKSNTVQPHAPHAERVRGNALRSARPTTEQIARRAYELWEARGCTGGSAEADWLQAERELMLGRQ